MCTSAQVSTACTPAAIAGLRSWATDQVVAWFDTPRDLVDDLAVVVAELASNAVRAGSADILAALTAHRSIVRLDIVDTALGMPVLTAFDVTLASGRGLHIVAALTTEWGVRAADPPPGKTVWTTLDVPEGCLPSFRCEPQVA